MTIKKIGSVYTALSENFQTCSVTIYFDKVREIQFRRNEDRIRVGIEVDWQPELCYFWLKGVEKLEFEADYSTFLDQCYEEVVLPDGRVFIQKKRILKLVIIMERLIWKSLLSIMIKNLIKQINQWN